MLEYLLKNPKDVRQYELKVWASQIACGKYHIFLFTSVLVLVILFNWPILLKINKKVQVMPILLLVCMTQLSLTNIRLLAISCLLTCLVKDRPSKAQQKELLH